MLNPPKRNELEEEIISERLPISVLADKMRLKADSLTSLQEGTVLVLPSNTAVHAKLDEAIFFREDAKEVLFTLKNANIPAKFYDDSRPKKSLDLRSADIVLPTILFVGSEVLKGALAAVGAWIAAKWLRENQHKAKTIKVEYVLLENGIVKKWARIEGPAIKVANLLRGHNEPNDGQNTSRKRNK